MPRKRLERILLYHGPQLIFLFLTWGVFFTYVFSNIVSLRKEGLFLGHPNAWSDWAHHIAIANIFAFKDPSFWFSYHPIFSEGKFTYPFLMDMISGIFMRAGFSLDFSFILPSIFFSLLFIISLYFLYYLISNSKGQSLLAVNIFLLSSGLGFINFVADFLKNPGLEAIFNPAREYSRFITYDWYTGSVIAGILIPQRAFLMGATFGVISLILLLYPLLRKANNRLKISLFFLSGIFAGILPIVHPHSLIALIILGGLIVFTNIRKTPQILTFVLTAGFLSSILYFIFINGGIESKSFLTLLPGWTSKGFFDFINMWALLWGAVIPASILGFIMIFRKISTTLKSTFFGFFLIFVLANIFLFQPIRWDNTKLFWWAYIGFSILTSVFILKLFRFYFLSKLAAILLFVSITFTGVLEVAKVLNFQRNTHLLTSREDMDLGIRIRNETESLDIFATATTHNSPVMVWGSRPIILGYTAWAYNFGFDYLEKEEDLYKIFQGGDDTKRLLEKHNVSYVFIGPSERNQFEVNEEFFQTNFPLAFSNSNNRVYKVR